MNAGSNLLFQHLRRKQIILFVTLLIAHPKTFAQDIPAVAGWTFDSFLSAALHLSDSVAEQVIQIQKQDEVVTGQKAVFIPKVTGTVQQTQVGGGQGVVVSDSGGSGVGTLAAGNSNVITSRLNLTANLFNGFQDWKNLKSAEATLKQNQFINQNIEYSQVETALELYVQALQDQSDLDHEKQEIETNRRSLERTSQNAKVGNARATEVINLESTIATNIIDQATSQASLEQNLSKASRLLNRPFQLVRLDENLPNCQAKLAEEELAKIDHEVRPDYQASAIALQAKQETLSSIKGKRLPTLDLLGSYALADNQVLTQAGSYSIGLTLTVPFPFDFQVSSQIAQADFDVRLADRQRAEKSRDLSRDRDELVRALHADQDQLDKIGEAKKLSAKNSLAVQNEHRSGLSSYTDVLTAQLTHQQLIRRLSRAALQLRLDCLRAAIWSNQNINRTLQLSQDRK